ncbi:TPA: site-specific integrase [Vibrio parahaemolyticus]|nr:site-specific integrase [Vibrio parahaemolyticus]HCG5559520.1 site-specific integrase [Vibrio parahaemolyticus]HCG7250484.1 site-specific integrase [Vibrio parahaemolyticus]HCG7253011.1 site-specific integrase [Vibrio parahaemolyticus]HCG7323942.1 site-specific integrase [Vibrio parahaemolyticus]
MRYLHISKSGIWQFRYQVSPQHRHLFGDRREIKRSLKTSDKAKATVMALELEIQVRKTILTPTASTSLDKHPFTPIISQVKTPSTNEISCYNALKRFCKYKADHISPKAVKMLEAKCKIVLDLVGKPHLKAIRRSDAESTASLLRNYPTNLKKHKQFEGLSGHEAIELNKELGLVTLSHESVKDYCQKMSGFFQWCQLNELTDINPFKAIRFKKTRRDSEAKNAYTPIELEKIFGAIVRAKQAHKHPYYFWLPLLAYFTGARLNELCQLYRADIYQVDGIWVIQIDDRFDGQRLKNLTSRRIVPIHDQLLSLGFIEFVQSVQHERIFPELKKSRDGFGTAASKWFGRFKTRLGFDRGHDFHSFRHTVATQLKRQQISHIVAGELLGHAQNNITYDRYGKGLDTAQLKEVINTIDAFPVLKSLKN